MDDSFDLDTSMSNAPSHTAHRKQSPQGGRGNNFNQKTCNNCGQPGHFAKFCPNGQNNHNNNGGGRNNQNSRQNGQNNKGGNANGQQNKKGGPRNFVDPGQTSPNAPCYMHPNGNHKNEECSNPQNVWNQKNGQNKSQNKKQSNTQQQSQPRQSPQQEQQPSPQQTNRHGSTRTNRSPLSGAEYNYCERCNERGHTALICRNAAPVTGSYILICRTCKNRGHSHTSCKHPAFCSNCKDFGHSRESCRNLPALQTLFETEGCKQPEKVFPHYTFKKTAPKKEKRVRFADTNGNFVLDEPLNDAAAELERIRASEAAERKRKVEVKCRTAYSLYKHKNINDVIQDTAEDLSRFSAEQLEQELPSKLLKDLVKTWLKDRSLDSARVLVQAGHNFYRDPRALQGIAEGAVPKCHGCAKVGIVLDAAFYQVKPGMDVLRIGDWKEWGPMVHFACKCSDHEASGYSFVQDKAAQMEC